jgi:hypothetical protein
VEISDDFSTDKTNIDLIKPPQKVRRSWLLQDRDEAIVLDGLETLY